MVGTGSQIPLRTKPPTVVSMGSGRVPPIVLFADTPCTPFQNLWLLLISVRPSSAESWNPAIPAVSATTGMRGASTTPNSDIRLRKSCLPWSPWSP